MLIPSSELIFLSDPEAETYYSETVLSSADALNFRFGKVGKKPGKTQEKNEKKLEKRRKPLPDATPNVGVIRWSSFSISFPQHVNSLHRVFLKRYQ